MCWLLMHANPSCASVTFFRAIFSQTIFICSTVCLIVACTWSVFVSTEIWYELFWPKVDLIWHELHVSVFTPCWYADSSCVSAICAVVGSSRRPYNQKLEGGFFPAYGHFFVSISGTARAKIQIAQTRRRKNSHRLSVKPPSHVCILLTRSEENEIWQSFMKLLG